MTLNDSNTQKTTFNNCYGASCTKTILNSGANNQSLSVERIISNYETVNMALFRTAYLSLRIHVRTFFVQLHRSLQKKVDYVKFIS